MCASSSCLPFLYQIQSDAGMSVVLLLFDYLSVSLSIRGRRGKSYYYLNPLSLKTSLGSKGGETLTGDWLNTTARDGLDNGCVTNTHRDTHTCAWLTKPDTHTDSEHKVELRPERERRSRSVALWTWHAEQKSADQNRLLRHLASPHVR